MEFQLTIDCHNDLGEGPLWDPREKTLYWLDINKAKIQRRNAQGTVQVFEMPFKVTALGLRQSGGFVAATERGFHFWDGQGTALKFITHPEDGKAGARFNDGKVDRGGRFWAGTMDPRSATSALYRLDPDHTYTRMAEGITISNGLGWDPNNHRMYYVDTLAYVVYAYNFNARKGSLSGRRRLGGNQVQRVDDLLDDLMGLCRPANEEPIRAFVHHDLATRRQQAVQYGLHLGGLRVSQHVGLELAGRRFPDKLGPSRGKGGRQSDQQHRNCR